MKKYVCLRDDDTCYYTNANDLVASYGWMLGKIPITFGVVPFSHGSQKKMTEFEDCDDRFRVLRDWEINASASELTEYHSIHAVGENKILVDELKKQVLNGKVEIAQHGVFHKYNELGPEMVIPQVSLPSVRDGKEYLSKLFETDITTFIPPSNTIDFVCAKYVSSLEMRILSCGGIRYKTFLQRFISKIQDPLFIKNKLRRVKKSPILRPSGITLLNSITFNNFDDEKVIYNKAKVLLESTGFVSITTHYMLLNPKGWHGQHKDYRDKYFWLINQLLKMEDLEFVTASEYGDLLLKKYYKKD